MPGHTGYERVSVSGRFCGPPGTANGGYVAGLLAEQLGGSAEVVLRRPTPLETALALRAEGGGWRLDDPTGELLAEARAVVAAPPPPPVTPPFAEALRAAAPAPSHPFPGCFVCGPGRAAGDGLRIFPGPLARAPLDAVAAPWVPDASLCAGGGPVPVRLLWAALDCPGALAAMAGAPVRMLLARMTAALSGVVHAGERCVVVGWRMATEGRKHACGTALFGADGALRGVAEQLWIEPRAA